MPELQRPEFVNRAAGEVDRLRQEIRQGVRGTEEVLSEYWDNLQQLLDELLGWVSGEVERIGTQGEEQRRLLEARVRELAGSAGGVVQRAGDAIGLGPKVDPSVQLPAAGVPDGATTAGQAAARKAAPKKSAAKKSGPKKAAPKKSAAKKSAAKKSAAKKSAAKKAGPKKSAPKKSAAKKSAAEQQSAKKQSAEQQ